MILNFLKKRYYIKYWGLKSSAPTNIMISDRYQYHIMISAEAYIVPTNKALPKLWKTQLLARYSFLFK
jgi:hypothetical protein